MKNLKLRSSDESGAVLIIVALVTLVLLILSAGGIMLFTLYGSQREMQKSADQAALAGAAALPLLNPGQTMDALPMNTYYELSEGVGLDVPVKSLAGIPDPRAVACAYGVRSLDPRSAGLTDNFGNAYTGAAGYCANAPWSDGRVHVTLDALSSPITACINGLRTDINGVINDLNSGLDGLLNDLLALLGLGLSEDEATAIVDETVARLDALLLSIENLEALSPALLTPEVTATVSDRVSPPLMSFVTGSDGVDMEVTATAERRLKNAVVLPDAPALTDVSLNSALAAAKPEVEDALVSLNGEINTLMGQLGLSECENLLDPSSKIYKDVTDLYNPPADGPAPTGRSMIEGASDSALRAAGDAGTTVDNLHGEAFVVIREGVGPTTLSSLLGVLVDDLGLSSTIKNLSIPAMDVAVVAAHNLEKGNISNEDLIKDLASARGLFTATLKN